MKPIDIRGLPDQTTSVRILMADDDFNRLLVKKWLLPYGGKVTWVDDGRFVLQSLQQNQYDLILLNLQLPYLSGQELVTIIRQSDSINQHSPCIAITTDISEQQKQHLIKAGFDQCLIKPVLQEQFNEIVELWLTDPSSLINQSTAAYYVETLSARTSGNQTLTKTLFSQLFSELKMKPKKIKAAISMGYLKTAREELHKLHGSFSFCGLTELQQAANALEISLINATTESISFQLIELTNQIDYFLSLEESILALVNLSSE